MMTDNYQASLGGLVGIANLRRLECQSDAMDGETAPPMTIAEQGCSSEFYCFVVNDNSSRGEAVIFAVAVAASLVAAAVRAYFGIIL